MSLDDVNCMFEVMLNRYMYLDKSACTSTTSVNPGAEPPGPGGASIVNAMASREESRRKM